MEDGCNYICQGPVYQLLGLWKWLSTPWLYWEPYLSTEIQTENSATMFLGPLEYRAVTMSQKDLGMLCIPRPYVTNLIISRF